MQKMTINLPTYSVELSAEHETELFKKAAFWLSLPTKCPTCSKPLIPNYRTPQTFEYYELKCTGTPTHSVNLGEAKSTHDLYFDPKKAWHTYDPTRTEHDGAPAPATPVAASPVDANLSGKRNALIKLISECKNAGLRTGILPPDVKDLDDARLEFETNRLGQMLLNAPTRSAAK